MKLLLDENLPKRLKNDFSEHEIFHVSDLGWNGVKNGELLKLMLANSFDVLLTFDKNLRYQQNFQKYPISVFVLVAERNQYVLLAPLVDSIKQNLDNPPVGPIIISN
jgi:predicted nuclease of predicted toxin-antitoxin system